MDRWSDQPAPFARDSCRLSYASILGEPLILDKFRDVGHPIKRGSVSPFLIAFDFHINTLLTLGVFWGKDRELPQNGAQVPLLGAI